MKCCLEVHCCHFTTRDLREGVHWPPTSSRKHSFTPFIQRKGFVVSSLILISAALTTILLMTRECSACICVCVAWCSWKPEERPESPEPGVTHSAVSYHWSAANKPMLSAEVSVLNCWSSSGPTFILNTNTSTPDPMHLLWLGFPR